MFRPRGLILAATLALLIVAALGAWSLWSKELSSGGETTIAGTVAQIRFWGP